LGYVVVLAADLAGLLQGSQTTTRFARADLDLKRQALAQLSPDAVGAPKAGGVVLHGTELTRSPRRL
jgi:integrase/recombinase XerD